MRLLHSLLRCWAALWDARLRSRRRPILPSRRSSTEPVPPPPGLPAIWIWAPGHWVWNGRAYAWVGGHYVQRRPGWTRWVPGHWVFSYGRWAWVPGHWV